MVAKFLKGALLVGTHIYYDINVYPQAIVEKKVLYTIV